MENIKLINSKKDEQKWKKRLAAVKLGRLSMSKIEMHLGENEHAMLKELSEVTGEYINKLAPILIYTALHDKLPEVEKLGWQKHSLERIEKSLAEASAIQSKISASIDDVQKQQQKHQKVVTTIFAETYAAIHLVMSYVKVTLVNVLKQLPNLDEPSPQVIEIVNASTVIFTKKAIAETEQVFEFGALILYSLAF